MSDGNKYLKAMNIMSILLFLHAGEAWPQIKNKRVWAKMKHLKTLNGRHDTRQNILIPDEKK